MDNYYVQHKDEIFKKYSDDELIRDIDNFVNGKGRLNKVLNHFFEEEIFKCKGPRGKLSPFEALQDNEIMEKILNYTELKTKFYVGKEVANVKSFFRNGGKYAQKVANFPPRQALYIYDKYTEKGDAIFDMSCGFGSRMSAALLTGRHYMGVDPNPTLFKKLEEYGGFLIKNELIKGTHYKVLQQGSEIFIPQIENKVDLCFTSPPYFDLEDYGNDDGQSINQFSSYHLWLDGFMRPTIENCFKYLKNGGYLAINIKNMTYGKKYNLFNDTKEIIEENNEFVYTEVLDIKQTGAKKALAKFHNRDVSGQVNEPVIVFQKKINGNIN